MEDIEEKKIASMRKHADCVPRKRTHAAFLSHEV